MTRALRRLSCLLVSLLLAGCTLAAATAPPPIPQPTSAPTASPTLEPSTTPTTAPSPTEPDPTLEPSATASPARVGYVVVIVLDGCRPDYFDLAELPNLRSLMNGGAVYSDAWIGALENTTSPSHASISTGVFPNRHGILSFNWLSPAAISSNDPTSTDAVNRGDMARIVEESGVPTLARLIKARYPDGVVAAVSSSKPYAAMALGLGPSDYILYGSSDGSTIVPAAVDYYLPPDEILNDPRLTVLVTSPGEENLFAARAGAVMVEKVRPRALLLNFAASDIYGHSSGGKIAPRTMRKVMEASDRAVGELIAAYRQAGIFDQTLWVITSDHGMIPNSKLVDPQELEAVASEAGMPGTGKAPYAFLTNPGQSQKLADAIAKKHIPGIVAVYYKLDLRDGPTYLPAPTIQEGLSIPLDAAYRYLLSTISGPTAPDVVITTAEDSQFGSGDPNTRGSHGWITWGDQHIPLILSGPDVKTDMVSNAPARLVDILPTIARLMDLPGADWDGLVLADALRSPSEADQSAQAAFNQLIAPLRDRFRDLAGWE